VTPRSYLYVPGNAPEKLAKADRWGADAVILDLEDSVPEPAKEPARGQVRRAVAALGARGGAQVWVRVNRPPHLTADLAEVATDGLAGVMVPKAEPGLLHQVDTLLTAAERQGRLRPGSLAVIALVETAQGLLAVREVAAAPRVVRLGLGEADLAGELGLRPGPAQAELTPLRLQVVVASAAAGLLKPIGPVETGLDDDQRLRSTTRALLALGFRARTAIHPRQLATINNVFTPSPAEIAQARRAVAALAAATADGSGVAVDDRNRMIDPAVARSADEVLLRHNDIG
jgi:citrate lyase subunit beta/citryl-CoA lyase